MKLPTTQQPGTCEDLGQVSKVPRRCHLVVLQRYVGGNWPLHSQMELPAFWRNVGQPKDEILSWWRMKKSPETKKDKDRERQRQGQSKWDINTDIHETRWTFCWKLRSEGWGEWTQLLSGLVLTSQFRTLMIEEASGMPYVLSFPYDPNFFPLFHSFT